MLTSVLTSSSTISLSVVSALLCIGAALALGLIIAAAYLMGGQHNKSLAIALAILPALVQVVIMMVNGNLGVGVAVLGAFSLIRFRSVPGSAKDICMIFFAMAVGLATGMGYLTYAALATGIVGAMFVLLSRSNFGERPGRDRELKITIPEDLDYVSVFDDLFDKYTSGHTLVSVKTTNLGSMFQLLYSVSLKETAREKEFIDELRCRNGNLTILCTREKLIKEEL